MAETLTTLLAIPFTTTSTSWALTVTDQAGTNRTVTINPSATARVYRVFLAFSGGGTPGTNSGTEADPDELLMHVQTQLNAALANLWTVSLSTAGLVQFTYNGTGTGQITFPNDTTLQAILGWTASVVGPANPASPKPGAYQPMFCTFGMARAADTGWSYVPQRVAAAELPTGAVVAWGDGYVRALRKFDLLHHPPGSALAGLTQATPAGALATPMYPAAASRIGGPTRVTTGLGAGTTGILPWSVWETLSTIPGVRFGAALGNFQGLRAGSESLFSDVYLSAQCLNARATVRPSVAPSYAGRYGWYGLELFHFAQMTR